MYCATELLGIGFKREPAENTILKNTYSLEYIKHLPFFFTFSVSDLSIGGKVIMEIKETLLVHKHCSLVVTNAMVFTNVQGCSRITLTNKSCFM